MMLTEIGLKKIIPKSNKEIVVLSANTFLKLPVLNDLIILKMEQMKGYRVIEYMILLRMYLRSKIATYS